MDHLALLMTIATYLPLIPCPLVSRFHDKKRVIEPMNSSHFLMDSSQRDGY